MQTATISKLLIVTLALVGIGEASAQMSAGEIKGLRQCLAESWSLPENVSAGSDIKVVLRILLKQDGALAAPPQVIEVSSSPLGPAVAESAKRAVLACQPFKMLSQEHYKLWKDMEITFNPRNMFARE